MTDQHDTRTAQTRRRELAIEHLLFGTIRHLAKHHPVLLDELDASVGNLWDNAHDDTRDDEAVRTVARSFIESLRREASRG